MVKLVVTLVVLVEYWLELVIASWWRLLLKILDVASHSIAVLLSTKIAKYQCICWYKRTLEFSTYGTIGCSVAQLRRCQ